ncbi:MAG: 2-oxoglutarate oxidoreductase [Candidatus Cloacimonetes bacterium 4572_55]|nr:MAG: 2-oxoglutarate oxidoreductase [Candidatus Cloacimonetes bacterium 4572_55]
MDMQTVQNKTLHKVKEHVVEVVSDSGEGAQRAAQTFATVSAKMGNSVWTVEIIPAEIEPPPRTAVGASGNRIRLGSFKITNAGDEADLIIAFNEQALIGRIDGGNLKPDCVILLDNVWRTHPDKSISQSYTEIYDKLIADGYRIIEIPMEKETLKHTSNPRRGKNMFALGALSFIYKRDVGLMKETISYAFRKKSKKVVDTNITLLEAGYKWAEENMDFQIEVPRHGVKDSQIVVNGNTAIGLGVVASGMEVCAMYPITPATSASHYLSDIFESSGGVVHQAEDEIAAVGFALGASHVGKCAVTITSGPGMALKAEFIGLAASAEVPIVIVNVQRGGPSTGLPTKVEQGDLLSALFGSPGDTPTIVMAAATIEDCFYSMITARKIAETFRTPVIVLSDTNLATGQQPFPRPKFNKEWVAPPIDQSAIPEGEKPYDWDEKTGGSRRFIPGQKGGEFVLTSFAHNQNGKEVRNAKLNQESIRLRSLKLAAFQKTLKTPEVFGDPEGDLLVVGWGSTKGAIEEAVYQVRKDGLKVSSLHLKFLQPMAPGIKEILKRFKKVMTVEINYSDELVKGLIEEDDRRYSNLSWLLRARYLTDVDCWSNVHGQPLKPRKIMEAIRIKERG